MNPRDLRQEYDDIVGMFRRLTAATWAESGLCCRKVVDGAPECCAYLPTTQDLVFTAQEVEILGIYGCVVLRQDGMFVLNKPLLGVDAIREALNDGWLANTLECASHPTRPIVEDGVVTGVVAIDACNTGVALNWYREHREVLQGLWQSAVQMTGMKPYYVTYGVRPGWTVL